MEGFNASKEQQALYYNSIAVNAKEKGESNSAHAEIADEVETLLKNVY